MSVATFTTSDPHPRTMQIRRSFRGCAWKPTPLQIAIAEIFAEAQLLGLEKRKRLKILRSGDDCGEDRDELKFFQLKGRAGGWSTVFGPQWESQKALHFKRGMYCKNGMLEHAGEILIRGDGIRATARATGISKNTIKKLHRVMTQLGVEFRCKCGQPSGHQGWCSWRFSKSESRQALIGRIGSRGQQYGDKRLVSEEAP